MKTAHPIGPASRVSLPPGPLSGSGAVVKVATLLALAALVGVTVWGALQVYRPLGRASEQQENLPLEDDVARVLALCAAGDTAGARVLARSLVKRDPTSGERARIEGVCRGTGKRPD